LKDKQSYKKNDKTTSHVHYFIVSRQLKKAKYSSGSVVFIAPPPQPPLNSISSSSSQLTRLSSRYIFLIEPYLLINGTISISLLFRLIILMILESPKPGSKQVQLNQLITISYIHLMVKQVSPFVFITTSNP
jgi:hypothetical protein